MDGLKRSALLINLKLEAIKSGITNVKSSVKDARNEIQAEIKDLANKLSATSDKTDSKIDRAVYFFIAGLMLKAGLDIYLKDEDPVGKVTPQAAK